MFIYTVLVIKLEAYGNVNLTYPVNIEKNELLANLTNKFLVHFFKLANFALFNTMTEFLKNRQSQHEQPKVGPSFISL